LDQRVLFLLLCGRRRRVILLLTFTCWKKRSLIVLRSNQRPAGNERPFFWTDKPADDMKTLIFCPKHKENDVGIFRKYYVELSHFKKVMTIWSRVIVTFLQKKKSNTTYIDWMVEKYWYSMFFNEKSQEFPPALCHCFVWCTKKLFRQSQ